MLQNMGADPFSSNIHELPNCWRKYTCGSHDLRSRRGQTCFFKCGLVSSLGLILSPHLLALIINSLLSFQLFIHSCFICLFLPFLASVDNKKTPDKSRDKGKEFRVQIGKFSR